jgi:FKBP-type peptidyl-prolyl cis-trans isomerase FkpA
MPQIAEGLEYEDQIVGDGDEAIPGKTVEVHYTGWLTDGSEFDSSRKRNETFKFKLGGIIHHDLKRSLFGRGCFR